MLKIQGRRIIGYVTVHIKGHFPERFIQTCVNEEIPIWNVIKIGEHDIEFNVFLYQFKKIKTLKQAMNYEISIVKKHGLPIFIEKFIKRKMLLLASLFSIITLLMLSQMIWAVQITGVSGDIEQKINEQLTTYGISTGVLTISLESASEIQQKLLKDVPELLWVGVHKKGTTYFIEGVEKKIVEEKENVEPQHLIATKNGVVEKVYISKGVPLVKVNDYVKRGDILASGIINREDVLDDDDEANHEYELVSAEGEVIANTWYEITVTIPLTTYTEHITGNKKAKHYIQIGQLEIPFWGFKNPEFRHIHVEKNETDIFLYKWKTPFTLIDQQLHEKEYEKNVKTEEEAIKAGIEQAKEDLRLKLGPEIVFLKENILHVATENGKVKLNLYLSVLENISAPKQINENFKK